MNIFKEYRLKNKLTVEELASKSYLDDTTIKKLESGKRKASLSTMKCLIIALNITAKDVFSYYSSLTPKKSKKYDIGSITQKELAKLSGLNKDTITNLKQGAIPKPITISKLINTLNITPKELYDYILSIEKE